MALGFVDIIISVVDAVVSHTIKYLEYEAVKKHGKRQIGLQQVSHQDELANKARELALSVKVLQTTGRTAILEDMQIKKVVGLGTVSVVLLVALALGLIYRVGDK